MGPAPAVLHPLLIIGQLGHRLPPASGPELQGHDYEVCSEYLSPARPQLAMILRKIDGCTEICYHYHYQYQYHNITLYLNAQSSAEDD